MGARSVRHLWARQTLRVLGSAPMTQGSGGKWLAWGPRLFPSSLASLPLANPMPDFGGSQDWSTKKGYPPPVTRIPTKEPVGQRAVKFICTKGICQGGVGEPTLPTPHLALSTKVWPGHRFGDPQGPLSPPVEAQAPPPRAEAGLEERSPPSSASQIFRIRKS